MSPSLRVVGALVTIVVCVAGARRVAAQDCTPRWVPDFVPGDFGGNVLAFATFDDGSGRAVFAGGSFDGAPGGVPARWAARWDGTRWSDAGAGLNGDVRVLHVHDPGDGSGPALYAGGDFRVANPDGTSSPGVARWDGARWVGVGTGVGIEVRDLASFADGKAGSNRLFATGAFPGPGGPLRLNGIAAWDGVAWQTLGTGLTIGGGRGLTTGYALAVFDDGGGAKLYVGGAQTEANGVPCGGLARWDGTGFEAVSSGVAFDDRFDPSAVAFVRALHVTTNGTPSLIVAGAFNEAGGTPANNIARWDGVGFSPLGAGLTPARPGAYVICLEEYGGSLYAGGEFVSTGDTTPIRKLGRFDGTAWQPVGYGVNTPLDMVAVCTGDGERLWVGGLSLFAAWDGKTLSAGGSGVGGTVSRARVFDLGDGPALYVVGNFTMAGAANARRIARWDGVEWSNLGEGLDCTTAYWSLEQFNDGTGEAIYVGGGALPCGSVKKWDGSAWSDIGAPFEMGYVFDLRAYDAGDGARLYALGSVPMQGGHAYRLASWDGSRWEILGDGRASGFPGGQLFAYRTAHAGPERLGITSSFSEMNGRPTRNLASWDGSVFAEIGGGVATTSGFLRVVDAGPIGSFGAGIYMTGSIRALGGTEVETKLAAWDGEQWRVPPPLHSGTPIALVAFDDGAGEAVYLRGSLQFEAGGPVSTLSRWSARGYESISTAPIGAVLDAVPMRTGAEISLFLVGSMRSAGGLPAGNIARVIVCPECPADWNTDGSVTSVDFFAFLVDFFRSSADFNGSGATDSQDLLDYIAAFHAGCG